MLSHLIKKSSAVPHAALFEAAEYSLFSGGKRLRPLLTLATCAIYSPSVEKALVPACALELVHTYSLIHDDLPSMDNDDFRRGKPTLHKIYPEGHAILTGDYLLSYAFELLAEAPALGCQQKLSLIQRLAKSAGAEGMVGGQVADLSFQRDSQNVELLDFIHQRKTAALIATAFFFGALIGEAPSSHFPIWEEIGKRFGLAFQLLDDLDDTEKEEKPNAVHLFGRENVEADIHAHFVEIDQLLSQISLDAETLKAIFFLYRRPNAICNCT